MADILVKNVDIDLLKEQRGFLLKTFKSGANEYADGLVNLIDKMTDIAEGFEAVTEGAEKTRKKTGGN